MFTKSKLLLCYIQYFLPATVHQRSFFGKALGLESSEVRDQTKRFIYLIYSIPCQIFSNKR